MVDLHGLSIVATLRLQKSEVEKTDGIILDEPEAFSL